MKKTLIIYTAIITFIFIVTTIVVNAEPKNEIIYIDPGHGGIDGGAVGSDGTKESALNLEIALKLKQKLESIGYTVYLTRDGDYDLAAKTNTTNRKGEDIRKRVSLINSSKASIYISIHVNSYQTTDVRGAQTFYKAGDAESKRLAEDVQNAIKENLQNTSRDAKTIKDKYLIDNINIPGCLVEVGFITNKEELGLLKDNDYQLRLVDAIIIGINQYFND